MMTQNKIEAIRKSGISFGIGLVPAFKQASKALTEFGNYFYKMAESLYKKQHGKLPGSNRTKRLRKKRKKIVLSWFIQQTAQCRDKI